MKYRIFSPFLLLLTISACTVIDFIEPVMPSKSVTLESSNAIDLSTHMPTQPTISAPATINPANAGSRESRTGERTPVFLEIIQNTIMGENIEQGPSLVVGSNIYFYNPDNGILSLDQTIAVDQNTELIIGIVYILQTPNQEYEKREIIQYPFMQPALIQIAAFDEKTDVITILFEDETFDLSVGESHTSKQVGGDSKISTLITRISNYGLLAEIQPISPNGSWR